MANENFEMIAKTLYGLEDVLANELTALGASNVEIGRRMVSFFGDKAMLYKANFYCRTALRILKPVCHFKASNADTVYEEVKKIEWEKYLSLDKTFAVDAVIYSDNFNHSKYVAYRTKDAIADYFNDKYEKRPSVRLNHPDMYVNIHISHNDCTVSIDSSGESLYKRGYRVAQVEAPLNEVLAAGMILKTGWRGESNFIDPMCGSGTILIEAAMIALNIAPGVYRKEFAFEKWPDFDRELFDEIYNDESEEREFSFKCYGSDISPVAIEKAMQNVRSAGLTKYIELKTMPMQQYTEAPQPGIIVMNPPYGERISTDDIIGLYTMIGERLKHVFMGYNAWILSYKEECFDNIGLRPKERIKLMNGELECEYRCYELFDGKNKEYKKLIGERDKEGFERKKPFERDKKPFERKPFDEERKQPFVRRTRSEGDDDESAEKIERHSYLAKQREGTFGRKEKESRFGERKPYERKPRSFDKRDGDERKPYERKPRSFDKRDGDERKSYERKPRSFDKRDGGDEHKSFGRKPYDKEKKTYGKSDRSFSKDKPFSKGRSYSKDKPSFSKSSRPKSSYSRRDTPSRGRSSEE